jgi:TolB protein
LSTGPAPAQAAFPGLNGRLACEGTRGPAVPDPNPERINRSEVFTINPDGTDEKVLTDNAFRDGDPSFSPDGKNIAFESFQPGFSEAYRMTTEGTGVTRLTFSGDNEDRSTNWSPDGTKIAFHSTRDRATIPEPGNPFEVYTMNADGSNQTRITNNIAQDSFPQYSPDGKKLVFTSNRDALDFEIYTMNPDGTNPVRLTNSLGEDAHPTWSPDGKQITFHSRRTGRIDIYRMNADGSNPTRLTKTDEAFEFFPVWSPDGTRIAFNGNNADPANFNFDVYTISAVDGSDLQRVTTAPGFDGRCDWQTIPRAAQNPSGGGNVPGGGASPLPPGGGGSSVPPKATVCANSAGVKVIGKTNSGGRVIQGTNGNNRICGTSAGDVITGNGGKDVISGGGGDDRINGGSGSDRVNGGSGKDRVSGSSGNDSISGSSGNDRINGNSGTDRITGGSGNDRLNGSTGNDVV